MNVIGGNVGNLLCPLALLIAIMCIFTQVHRDACSRPLGAFLVGCGVVYFITVLAACCGVGTAHMKDNPVAKIAATLNGFTGLFMVIWLCVGIYWLTGTEKEPTNGILSSAANLVKGSVNAATGTVGQATGLTNGNGVDVTTLTQSLASRGLCNKHLWNMSLVIIILSFLWCPCLLMAMVCMLWNTVRNMSKGNRRSQSEAFSSDSN